MAPTVRHGESFRAEPFDRSSLRAGALIVAAVDGVPDLYRILDLHDDTITLGADSVPGERITTGRAQVVAMVASPFTLPSHATKCVRRVFIEIREAMLRCPSSGDEKAATVRSKYDSQAPFYARNVDRDLDPSLLTQIGAHVPPGGRILVLGSGNGYDCFALERRGYRPVGVDFSPAMIRLSNQEAERRRSSVVFRLADLRSLDERDGSFDAVLFTHEVYSFCPEHEARVRLLRRLRSNLTPEGVIFLSARRVRGIWGRFILTLQWFRHAGLVGNEWGDSHTRYLLGDGTLRRSFVHLLTPHLLARESRRAGYVQGRWVGGHAVLAPPPRTRASC
ncbi:MAG TPA: class I SAM-dependent methyltransferase [Candidatus Polarisedimenticolia bacterium]|nr:class I SAM-dependent methyltransferase [Candidatus Polarisedimenticolia bacterium]